MDFYFVYLFQFFKPSPNPLRRRGKEQASSVRLSASTFSEGEGRNLLTSFFFLHQLTSLIRPLGTFSEGEGKNILSTFTFLFHLPSSESLKLSTSPKSKGCAPGGLLLRNPIAIGGDEAEGKNILTSFIFLFQLCGLIRPPIGVLLLLASPPLADRNDRRREEYSFIFYFSLSSSIFRKSQSFQHLRKARAVL